MKYIPNDHLIQLIFLKNLHLLHDHKKYKLCISSTLHFKLYLF